MPIFTLARRPTNAIRIALAALLLAIGLNSIAHAGHSHDAPAGATAAALHAGCGSCSAFAGFADAPRAVEWSAEKSAPGFPPLAYAATAAYQRTPTSACPRGPPRI